MLRKVKDHFKQFGSKALLTKFISYLVRPFFTQNSLIILAKQKHEHCEINATVKRMSPLNINHWLKESMIGTENLFHFRKFLEENSKGYYIEQNDELIAWGFVQTGGSYRYGKYLYEIPNGVHVLKNLFVKSTARGRSYGKLINEARINDIPEYCLPVGFVIPENKYALRNLKILGFEEFLLVKHVVWFNTWKRRDISIIQHSEISNILLEGFQAT